MEYGLNPLDTYCTDFELRYPGYRIEGVIGQEIDRHFPEMEWNKNSPFGCEHAERILLMSSGIGLPSCVILKADVLRFIHFAIYQNQQDLVAYSVSSDNKVFNFL